MIAHRYPPSLEGTLFERHVDGVFVIDHDGRVVACNDSLLNLVQYERRDLLGLHCTLLIDESHRARFSQRLEHAFNGEALRVTVRGHSQSSSRWYVELTLIPDISEHVVVVIVRDTARTFPTTDVPDPVSVNLSASHLARFAGWSIDLATGETTWSDEMYAILGYETDGAPSLELTLDRHYDEENRAIVEAAVLTCVEKIEPFDIQCKVLDFHGNELTARIIAQPVLDEQGSVIRIEGAFYDLSDFAINAHEISAAERNIVDAFELVSLPLFLIGRDWTFRYVNQAGLALARLRWPELRNRTFWEAMPSAQHQIFGVILRSAMENNEVGAAVVRVEELGVDVDVLVNPTPEGVLIAARNVTEARDAKRQLDDVEEARSALASILDLTKDAVIVTSFDDGVTYWNQGAVDFYGWTFDEVRGTSPVERINVNPADAYRGIETATREGYWRGVLHQQSRLGRVIQVEARLSLWRDRRGNAKGLLGVYSDVTEARQEEEVKIRAQRLESIGTLAGGIAHDLNNVLTPMTLSLELLSLRLREESNREIVNGLRTGVTRATNMVRQVLSFARGTEGVRSNVVVERLLVELLRFCETTLPKNIEVMVHREPLDATVWGDETQLMQVLINLVTNARDAMPDGGQLTIRVGPMPSPSAFPDDEFARQWAVIEIADTGVGMDRATASKIFEPFFTTKALSEGTGLGLSTSMTIVQSHGGRLLVDSKVGHGTTFRVELPLDGDGPADSDPASDAHADQGNRQTGRLLVVDDEPEILRMLIEVLKSSGYDVQVATSAAGALDVVANNTTPFDLVLTDINMPQMNGVQLARRLIELDARSKVIFMTGRNDQEIDLLPLRGTRAAVLHKPFTVSQLLHFVDENLAASD